MIKVYTITFKDIKERTVVIQINNQDLEEGETVALVPGASPFKTQEDDDYDPMAPFRSGTARISVKCTYGEIIPVTNNVQWHTTVRRAGTLVWSGYLRAEMGDMDFSAIPDEITYQADDMLGVLRYGHKYMSRSLTSFASLLQRTYLNIDNSTPVPARGEKPWQTLSELKAFPQNWIDNDENDQGVPEEVTEMQDVVESDIASFLGVTVRYYMNQFYMGSLFGTKFYKGQTEQIYEAIDGTEMTWTGFSTVKWENGIGRIVVESGGRNIEDGDMPDTDDDNMQVLSVGYMPPQESQDTSFQGYNCFYRILKPLAGCGIDVQEYPTNLVPSNRWSRLGVHILDTDIWNTDGERKYDFSFSRSYVFIGTGIPTISMNTLSMPRYSYTSRDESEAIARSRDMMMAGLNRPLLTLSSVVPIYAKNGGITIDMTYQEGELQTVYKQGISYRRVTGWGQDTDFSVAQTRAIVSLNLGDMWWNGTAWQSTQCTFAYMLNDTNNPVVKSLEMLFQGKKLAMPISGIMSGVLTFSFYGAYNAQIESEIVDTYTEYTCTWKPEELIKFSTLNIQYNPPLDLLTLGNTDKSRVGQNTIGFPDDNTKTFSLSLCSLHDDKAENWGMVYKDNNVIRTLHWPKLRDDWSPERLVLKKHVLALARTRTLATIAAECEYEDLPFRRIDMLGRTWYPLAVSTDWRDCKSEILAVDITDIMAELPAVGTDEESEGGDNTITVTASGSNVTLTMSDTLPVIVIVTWSTETDSGSALIPAGETTTTFNCGTTIQDERDIGFSATTSQGDTFNFVYDL